jgi:outer membrane immunogenic protein
MGVPRDATPAPTTAGWQRRSDSIRVLQSSYSIFPGERVAWRPIVDLKLQSGVIMNKFLLSAVGLIATATSAAAADLAARPYTKAPPMMVPAVYDWTGGYVGVEGGYGWGHSDQTDPGIAPPSTEPPPPLPRDGHYTVRGGLIGGTLGYNWQAGPWVFGLEGDYSWSDIKGHSDVCGPTTVTPRPCGTKLESFGTFRGRVGYAAGATGNVLLYATGGLAVGDVHAWDALTRSFHSL